MTAERLLFFPINAPQPKIRHSRAGGNLVRSVSVFLASAATLNF
ncbi:hypothetical protein [Neisseria meningitidis serogroup B]|uniref:Uncharacterized protein n=1 Tax=Neisseria meningitidis serogroup B TaxID=491 RepID=A0A0H5QC21_NEIMI|nr:hypothetical protein [Neisseria meningitidis serogroup B]